jgi:hypothetical protein
MKGWRMKPVSLGRLTVRKVFEMESGPPMSLLVPGIEAEDLARLSHWHSDETLGATPGQSAFTMSMHSYVLEIDGLTVLVDACNGDHHHHPTPDRDVRPGIPDPRQPQRRSAQDRAQNDIGEDPPAVVGQMEQPAAERPSFCSPLRRVSEHKGSAHPGTVETRKNSGHEYHAEIHHFRVVSGCAYTTALSAVSVFNVDR